MHHVGSDFSLFYEYELSFFETNIINSCNPGVTQLERMRQYFRQSNHRAHYSNRLILDCFHHGIPPGHRNRVVFDIVEQWGRVKA